VHLVGAFGFDRAEQISPSEWSVDE